MPTTLPLGCDSAGLWDAGAVETLELELGQPASGGGNVARLPDGRVAFVRHGAEGERVRVRLTEERARFVRADVVEVLVASPHRVMPPCAFSGAGGCGGCDYQHLDLAYQREVKAALLVEQLDRLANLEAEVVVEPAARPGLANRSRVRFQADGQGRLAMRASRSHDLVAVERCALAVEAIDALGLGQQRWPVGCEVEAVALEGSAVSLVAEADEDAELPEIAGLTNLQRTQVAGTPFEVDPEGFWQVHREAPELLTAAVLEAAGELAGARVLDLYCGAGLFTVAIAARTGAEGSVVGIESARRSVNAARRNLKDFPWARVELSRVDAAALRRYGEGAQIAVLDPPRAGAGAKVLEALSSTTTLERIVSVSCDAATFARDLRTLLDLGWKLDGLAAFDLFEFTEHSEQVALLTR